MGITVIDSPAVPRHTIERFLTDTSDRVERIERIVLGDTILAFRILRLEFRIHLIPRPREVR